METPVNIQVSSQFGHIQIFIFSTAQTVHLKSNPN